MNPEIYYLFLNDDLSYFKEPFGWLVTSNSDVSDVTFCFDKQDLLDVINLRSAEYSEGTLLMYETQVKECYLPDAISRESITIDGYVGLKLAQAMEAHCMANNVRFRPHSSWPVIASIPRLDFSATFLTLYDDSAFAEDERDMCNAMFIHHDGFENIVSVVHSWEQLEYFLQELHDSSENLSKAARKVTASACLPETSDEVFQKIHGEVADCIAAAMAYYQYMLRIVNFGTPSAQENYVNQ